MTDYFKRLALIIAMVVAIVAVLGIYVLIVSAAAKAFGFFGLASVIVLTACALAAASPDGGTGPR
jgi:hypothetical protein